MSDVEELRNILDGAFDKEHFNAILAKYVDMVPWLVIDLPMSYPIYRGREMEADAKTKPLKWSLNVHNEGDRLPEPLRNRFMKDDKRFREDVKAAGYNRGRTKLVKRRLNIK